MTKYFLYLGALCALAGFISCEDDTESAGRPELTLNSDISAAQFGDSIAFTTTVTDPEIALSTLKAQLYFGDEMVSETIIRTKTNGQYSGKIFVPSLQNIPNGTATLKFVLQNIRFSIAEETFNLPLTRPDYSYLTLVTPDGEYTMTRTGLYEYTATAEFPQKVKGYIKTPVSSTQGNEITFGWVNSAVKEGSVTSIPFSNATAGSYSITFNTQTYEAAPFVTLKFAGTEMSMIDDDNYKVELTLSQGQNLVVEGIGDFDEWWMDEDFFTYNQEGTLTFRPVTNKYKITANFTNRYFIVEAMTGSDLSTLQDDGSGALWIIGTDIGKPTLDNEVGWNTDKALSLSQIEPKRYQITVVAGESINSTSINFKFFHQKNWGGEYSSTTLTSTSPLVFVGDGTNGRDSGNLGITEGLSLTEGKSYLFSVDITGGKSNAILSVTEL